VTKLFIYGTLQRGHSRAKYLQGQQYVGVARTRARYRLYDCGTYPGLVPADDGVAVEGELWEVDPRCLAILDRVEGVAEGLYRRSTVELDAPFDAEHVQAYLYSRGTIGLRDCGRRWR